MPSTGCSVTHFCPKHANQHLSFIWTRETEAKRDSGRNYETCSQHSFQFNDHCSMSCFDKEWIWGPIQFPADDLQLSVWAVPKGCQIGGWKFTPIGSKVSNLRTITRAIKVLDFMLLFGLQIHFFKANFELKSCGEKVNPCVFVLLGAGFHLL